ncbi:MAG: hypothetical protein KC636_22110, partial [Myxococcales bacterium]|nr:hypothetical protein [Myxococcales bacterium]
VAFGADGETVVVIDARGELTALRLDSGEPVAAPIHHPNTGLATIRTSLSHDRETFWAVDEDAGWLLGWQVPRARLNPAVALARDGARSPAQVRIDPAQARVYGVVEAERFGDPARVAAWSLTDGAQQWRTELAAVDHWYARLTSDDARVAVASRRRDITGESSPRSGLIDVLQASDGALVARHEERPGEPTQLALAGDELAVEWIRRVYRDDKLEREEHVFERLPVAGGEPTQTCVFPEDASARGYTEDLRYRVGGTPEEPRVWLLQATCPELTGPAFAELISERTSGWPLDDPRARTGASWRDAALLGPPFVAPLLAPGVDEQRTAELVIPGRMQVLRTLRAAPTLGALPGPVAGPWLQLWDPYGAQARPLSGRLWIGNVDSWIRARSGVTLTAAGDGLLYVDAEDRVITHHLGPTPDEPIPGWAVALAEALDEAPPTDAPAPMSDEGSRATAPTIAERAAVDPEMAARQAVRARLQEAADAGDAHATWLIKQAPALRPLTPDP